jgi:NTE family protein
MLTSNLPVETARAMGADVVIAVNVGTPLLKREQITSILGVVGQMLSILTEQNVQASLASLKPTDILITPELGDFSTGDFDHLGNIIPLGEAAARKMAERLKQFSIPAAEYAALRQRQQVEVVADTRPIDEIRIAPLQRVNPEAVEKVMRTQAGKPLDQQVLDADLRRIYGTGDFEHVSYRFMDVPGTQVLQVVPVEKTWGPDYLHLGLGLSTDFKGDAFFNLLASYRRTWLNSLGAEWRTDLQVGRTTQLVTEWYQPLDPAGNFFVAPHAGIQRSAADIYQGKNRIASYSMANALAGVDVGVQLRQYGVIRLGMTGGVQEPKLDTGPTSLSPGASHISRGAFTAAMVLDQLDSVHFPRSGWKVDASVYNSNDALGADDKYTKWDLSGGGAYSFGEHTINAAVKFGGRWGSDPLPRYDQFQWGGFGQMTGLRTGQLYGERLSYGRLMYYQRVMKGSLLEGAYAGLMLEAAKVGNPVVPGNTTDWIKGASVLFAADTPLGPAYLSYGRASGGNSNLYFYLGRPF